jgi:predicted HNH restriction endonuclease
MADRDALSLEKRRTSGTAWVKSTAYYLDLNSDRGVAAAIPLLLYASKAVSRPATYLLPSESEAVEMPEGGRSPVLVNRFQRDPRARKRCLQLFGTACTVCNFDFERTYGEVGIGFIRVHHLKPLPSLDRNTESARAKTCVRCAQTVMRCFTGRHHHFQLKN